MPPSLTYWTGIWEPRREALSKEVDLLRRRLAPGARVISYSAGQRSGLSEDRTIRLSARRYGVLRAIASMGERLTDFNHVIGGLDAWHLLRVIGRRPTLFTAAIDGPPLAADLYGKVSCFVPETRRLADRLLRAGVPASRIELVHPGVDLDAFRPLPRPVSPFRVLFASTPARPSDFERRGIPLIVEAARRAPDVEVVLLWRQWGDVDGCARALEALDLPSNVRVEMRDATDMAAVFQSVHATFFLPAQGHGKSCPNSVIEGLAAGCPAIVNQHCGIADEIEAGGAGVVVSASPEDVARAMRELRQGVDAYARDARRLAERSFSERGFLQHYADLYQRLGGPEASRVAKPSEVIATP